MAGERSKSRLTISVTEAATILGLSRNSAYQGITTGEIPHIKIGKRILIPIIALERCLNGCATAEIQRLDKSE